MAQAKNGDTVRVHYTGTLADGTVFDSSAGGDALEFTLGAVGVISGFEAAVIGMSPGETTTKTVSSEEAYGPHMAEMVLEVPLENVPADWEPEVGQQLMLQHPSGATLPVLVTGVTDSTVTLDANHPLAGEDLTFRIELVEIVA